MLLLFAILSVLVLCIAVWATRELIRFVSWRNSLQRLNRNEWSKRLEMYRNT